MDIKQYVNERITKNSLPLKTDEVVDVIDKYATVYPDITEDKRFFHYVMNTVGEFLNEIDNNLNEILGWMKVKGRGSINFYYFDDEQDYYNWLGIRKEFYTVINDYNKLRLLNYMEISCMNFIHDISTKSNYDILDKEGNILETVEKLGMGNSKDDTMTFFKYIVSKFNAGYIFKVK